MGESLVLMWPVVTECQAHPMALCMELCEARSHGGSVVLFSEAITFLEMPGNVCPHDRGCVEPGA